MVVFALANRLVSRSSHTARSLCLRSSFWRAQSGRPESRASGGRSRASALTRRSSQRSRDVWAVFALSQNSLLLFLGVHAVPQSVSIRYLPGGRDLYSRHWWTASLLCSPIHPFEQRTRVYSGCAKALAGRLRGRDTVHRAGISVGERLLGDVHKQATRQATEQGGVRQPQGDAGFGR